LDEYSNAYHGDQHQYYPEDKNQQPVNPNQVGLAINQSTNNSWNGDYKAVTSNEAGRPQNTA